MTLSIDKLINIFAKMQLIRETEEQIAARYSEQKMRCPTHLSVGQEAAAVGACMALNIKDLAVSTHRAHAHYLAKGGNLSAMIAEIHGKETGCSQGRGGSMHLTDPSVGFVASTAIVGNSIPIGVGLALNLQLNNAPEIVVIFLGDGSVEEGAFYESACFAAVRGLPVLFVCENNMYSVYSPLHVRQPAGRKIYEMVRGLGLEAAHADGNDVLETLSTTCDAISYIKSNQSPFFLELKTYRWLEHCGPNYDNHIGYRSEEEFNKWRLKDPISAFERHLITDCMVSHQTIIDIKTQIKNQVDQAFEEAEQASFPSSEKAFSGLFANNDEVSFG